jgi:excisionase family DNA binding protein
MVTVKEAAEYLGISERAVRKRLMAGTLAGTRTEHGWAIDLDAAPPERPEPVPRPEPEPPATALLELLHEKDRQIAEKDRQYKDLLDVLKMQAEQIRLLRPPPAPTPAEPGPGPSTEPEPGRAVQLQSGIAPQVRD